MLRWKRDLITGIIIVIAAIGGFIYALGMPVGTMGKIYMAQPGTYLRIWLSIVGILGLALIIQTIIKRDKEAMPIMFHKMAVFTIVMLALYTFAMKYIGFFISTNILSIIIVLVYSLNAGKFSNQDGTKKSKKECVKQIVMYVIIGVIIAIVTNFVFGSILNVNLPKNKLF